MFRYQDINQSSNPAEVQRKVVTEVRAVTYVHSNGVIAHGFETVKEVVVSPEFNATEERRVVGHKTVQVEIPIKRKKKDEEVEEE